MKLALKLPGFEPSALASPVPGLNKDFTDLASLITPLINIAFFAAMFLAFFYLVWGAFQYILAQGKKEDLAKARSRITWALIGLIVTLLAFFLARFGAEVLPPTRGGLPF